MIATWVGGHLDGDQLTLPDGMRELVVCDRPPNHPGARPTTLPIVERDGQLFILWRQP